MCIYFLIVGNQFNKFPGEYEIFNPPNDSFAMPQLIILCQVFSIQSNQSHFTAAPIGVNMLQEALFLQYNFFRRFFRFGNVLHHRRLPLEEA